ncbi:arsenate reductase (glutaredoxin) [Parashewanella spongiae]|uniref:Arsenate reductase n=1 Tax=Parashewanella spongiae TaxID=342950 RepID=A0A3A6TEX9_9GAMM|nr:arsenate reductase (glutaredoxin) [Parashewanella spongiae]MCL1079617.1 arsenate reductase (glutaredoxin) [Parashewanella spongiae]RJY07183.1 arsenate reductase (glutaredoxin) [Parashewanella spongiae]
MTKVTIFHNPRCSKSRETLALLNAENCEITVIEYLSNTPTIETLTEILEKLAIKPRNLMRIKESEYKELGLNNESLTDIELINAMISSPKLIERPIVLANGKAAIGRPPENVLNIL